MNKRSMALLERAFVAEIDAAAGSGFGLIQSKGKLVEQLVSDGYLKPAAVELRGRFPVTIKGYILTVLGHLTYCMSCTDEQEAEHG